ncbi:MAG: alpha/beta hydrolase-fold protein, partial [Bryobacteraceae bacterium]
MARPRAGWGAIACAGSYLIAQSYVPGPQVLTFLSDVDDTDQPYALYLPPRMEPGKKYPLVVSLHGEWSNHRLDLRRVFGKGNRAGESDLQASRFFPRLPDVDYIVASPFARGTLGYRGIAEREVYAVTADVKRRFPVDENRVYLAGASIGGAGALRLGLTRPDQWAAVVAVCPAPSEDLEALAPNALHLPVHLFHGDADIAAPVALSRRWHSRLLKLGSHVEYREYPGIKHNAWDTAFHDAAIFRWLDKFRRPQFPDRVRFVTEAYKYWGAYWVEMDRFTPGTAALIDAAFTGANRLEIATQNLDSFTLRLAGHPKFSDRAAVVVSVDGAVLRQKGPQISFTRDGSGWRVAERPVKGGKRLGAEGPIPEAIAGRHLYVYGDGLAEEAARAAQWSIPSFRLPVSFRAVSHREVTETEIQEANLILFGTRQNNTLVDRFADRLPLELNASAADYG